MGGWDDAEARVAAFGQRDETLTDPLEGVGGLGEVEPFGEDGVWSERGEFSEEGGLVLA